MSTDNRPLPCRSCGASIVFLLTTKGKKIPVNANTVKPGDTHYDYKRHTSHFSTCPNAKQHRKS